MLKVLRVVFIAVLMLCFLISCKNRKQEVSTVLKTAPKVAAKKTEKKMPSGSAAKGSSESQLKEQLRVSSRELHGNKLYSFVLDWYGTPYRYGGCQKSGVDCSCFASILCEKVYGYSIPRTAGEIFRACSQLSLRDAREGDLVFFNIGGKKITHVGVYLKDKLFVHASTSRGVIVNSLEEAYYKKYFFSAGRMKEA